MSIGTILIAIFIAGSYAAWPILAKWSGASGQWATTIVVAATVLPVAGFSAKSMMESPIKGWKTILILVAAGLLNGVAVYLYGMKAADKAINTKVFVMVVSLMFFVWAPFVDWVINNQMLNQRQLIGVILAIGAVYMLKG